LFNYKNEQTDGAFCFPLCLLVFYMFLCFGCGLVAIDANVTAEKLFNAELGAGDAVRVSALYVASLNTLHSSVVNTPCVKQLQYKRHADKSSVCRLIEVVGSWIFVNVNVNLVNSGEGVEY